MAWLDRLNAGLARTRERFVEQINVIFDRSPALDDDFWESLEETLILADFGGPATIDIIDQLQDTAQRLALPDAAAIHKYFAEIVASMFTEAKDDPFDLNPVCILFVGINGSGKTTTVGKLAKDLTDKGRRVMLGSADTFRAAAIEQLDVWAKRAQVPVIKRERGSDPASVSFEAVERAEQYGADAILIDTAGRLHTSEDLMRELEKVVKVTRKRATQFKREGSEFKEIAVKVVLVLDATTGQNGLQQAKEFNKALDLDGVVVTKLDGTAKGGIAVAVSHELNLPILRIGVGESIEDLKPFVAIDFASALIGQQYKD